MFKLKVTSLTNIPFFSLKHIKYLSNYLEYINYSLPIFTKAGYVGVSDIGLTAHQYKRLYRAENAIKEDV